MIVVRYRSAQRNRNQEAHMKAFISYSHRDDWARERLQTHLATLRREGRIDDWSDRRILPGETLD